MTARHGYRLPSIAVSSPYDTPAVVHTLPVNLENRDSGIAVLEGGFAMPTRLCRFVRESGLIAVQLGGPLPETMVVTLRLTSDPQAEDLWLRQREIRASAARLRGLSSTETAATTQGLHRLLRLGAQGRLKARVLLDDPTEARATTTTQQVGFTVRREELDDSRLLMVSVTDPRIPPDWGLARHVADPVVGVKVAWLRVRQGDGNPPLGVSTGRQGEDGWRPWSPTIGYAALNCDQHRVRLLLSRRESTPRLLRGRAARAWPSAVEIRGEDGTLHRLELQRPGRDGISAVEVPGTGPALVRLLDLPDGDAGWWLRVVSAEG